MVIFYYGKQDVAIFYNGRQNVVLFYTIDKSTLLLSAISWKNLVENPHFQLIGNIHNFIPMTLVDYKYLAFYRLL